MNKLIVCAVIILGSTAAWGLSDDGDAVKGKALFENAKLGTNGKSCNSCHPGGRKLEWPATYPDDKLAEVVNGCITTAMKGKPLPVDKDDMNNLLRYIRTFAGP